MNLVYLNKVVIRDILIFNKELNKTIFINNYVPFLGKKKLTAILILKNAETFTCFNNLNSTSNLCIEICIKLGIFMIMLKGSHYIL